MAREKLKKKMGMKMIDIAWIDWTKLLYFCRDN